MVRAGSEAGIIDPTDAGMLLEMTRNGKRILRVALEPQMQRLNPLQQQEGAVRRQRGAGIAQPLDACFQNEGQRTERPGVRKTVIRRIRRREFLEAAGSGPVE